MRASGICIKVITAVALLIAAPTASRCEPGAGAEPPARVWRTVERVVDGDTLLLDGGEKVRLIGVDTPESVHPRKPVQRLGKEAAAFTRGLVEGEPVRLTYDWDPADRYGRTLAYAHLRDGRVLNEVLLERGFARAYTRFPFEQSDRYRALERAARQAEVGLWAPTRPTRPTRQRARAERRSAPRTWSSASLVVTPTGACVHRPGCSHVRGHRSLAVASAAGRRPCRDCLAPAR